MDDYSRAIDEIIRDWNAYCAEEEKRSRIVVYTSAISAVVCLLCFLYRLLFS